MECCEGKSPTVGENSCASKSSMLSARLGCDSKAVDKAFVEEQREAIGEGRIMRLGVASGYARERCLLQYAVVRMDQDGGR